MKYWLTALALSIYISVWGQQPFAILQRDTTVACGSTVFLSIDSSRLYSNFIFCAQDTVTTRWTIWKKKGGSKYEPLFSDAYNRMNVALSADRKELLYVKYRTQAPGNMYYSRMDSAWVCTADVDGKNERVVFLVPEFNKNAVYDLDWSFDKTKILYALGNDQYPSLTRDGDIFEYEIATGKHTNLTNDWQLWSKNCRYKPGTFDIAYSHFANFWEALPTDIFFQQKEYPRQQITTQLGHQKGYRYCTLTDVYQDIVLYRRGLYFDNKLYAMRRGATEQMLYDVPGTGGVYLGNDVYAATDFYNNIHLFTARKRIGTTKVSAIRSFNKDHTYNYALDCNTRLNWLGKLPATVQWSDGATGSAISAQIQGTTTYKCTINFNGTIYTDSVTVTVKGPQPRIDLQCMTLHAVGKYAAYQWYNDDKPIAGATDTLFTPEHSGSYTVEATDKKGRKGRYSFLLADADLETISRLNRQVSVNTDPATNTISVSAPFVVNMILRDSAGRTIAQQKDVHSIQLEHYPDGEYDLLLFNDNCVRLRNKRVIKKT